MWLCKHFEMHPQKHAKLCFVQVSCQEAGSRSTGKHSTASPLKVQHNEKLTTPLLLMFTSLQVVVVHRVIRRNIIQAASQIASDSKSILIQYAYSPLTVTGLTQCCFQLERCFRATPPMHNSQAGLQPKSYESKNKQNRVESETETCPVQEPDKVHS